MKETVSIFWFRRDLRLEDNAGLYYALRSGNPVVPVFIFDKEILDDLEDKHDRRVCFIRDEILKLQQQLEAMKSSMHVLYATPVKAFEELIERYDVAGVFTNHDYEPYAKQRDEAIAQLLSAHEIAFKTFKDQVIFEQDEIMKEDGTPYLVYTPYSKKWLDKLDDFFAKPYPTEKYFKHFLKSSPHRIPSLEAMGFKEIAYDVAPPELDKKIALEYHQTRNQPGVAGTTRLSVHLRFGTISIRQLTTEAQALNHTLLKELIWREFFMMILWHFPNTINEAFKPAYDNIEWRKSDADFERWCSGNTGFPIVDAGMRELNETGFMHNRVRMVTASFLCKHLLIDWRRGEAYFAQKLLDYDMAQNVGNWQWVAGSGVDSAPYFRIFNPHTQAEKFDKEMVYINKWVPERNELTYREMIDHKAARERCLKAYSVVKKASD